MIETQPVFMLNKRKRKMHMSRADNKGNEVIGSKRQTRYITDELALAKYDLDKPTPFTGEYRNQLDGEMGEVEYIEGFHGVDLVTKYDMKNRAKLPESTSQLSSSIRNN